MYENGRIIVCRMRDQVLHKIIMVKQQLIYDILTFEYYSERSINKV